MQYHAINMPKTTPHRTSSSSRSLPVLLMLVLFATGTLAQLVIQHVDVPAPELGSVARHVDVPQAQLPSHLPGDRVRYKVFAGGDRSNTGSGSSRVRKMVQEIAHRLLHSEQAPCRKILPPPVAPEKHAKPGEHELKTLERRQAPANAGNTTAGTGTANGPPSSAPAAPAPSSSTAQVPATTSSPALATIASTSRTIGAATPPTTANTANTPVSAAATNPGNAANSMPDTGTTSPTTDTTPAASTPTLATSAGVAAPADHGASSGGTTAGTTDSTAANTVPPASPGGSAATPAVSSGSGSGSGTASTSAVNQPLPTLTVSSGTNPISADNFTALPASAGGRNGAIAASATTGSDGTVTEVDTFATSPSNIPARPQTSTVVVVVANGTGPPTTRTTSVIVWVATQTHPPGEETTNYIDVPANETASDGTKGKNARLQGDGNRSRALDTRSGTLLALSVALTTLFGSFLVL